MCSKCDNFDQQVFDFENSPAERQAFHEWLTENVDGSLSEFRDTDEWAQAFCESDS